MTVTKALLLAAFVGYIICWYCDLLLIYTPSGRFQFAYMKDSGKMSEIFREMPLKKPLVSMLLGILALVMEFCGYLSLYEWMKQFSMVYAELIIISAVLFFIPGAEHHVFCGVVEWFYIRLGRTEEALNVIVEFFKKTSITMYICYLGILIFAVSFFVAVVAGHTSLPQWGCIFNFIPLFAVLAPFKTPGAGNLAGAVMFLGLFLLL
ncbi:MAG: hypothetical protein K2K56_02560 [Lachnospiraceae bacterium]|nr:hypothetical protein [Lachnospiraceae bacterium]